MCVVLEEHTKEVLVLDVSETEQLKLVPVKMTNQNIGGDKTEDFALMGSEDLLCVTSAGSVKKVKLKREMEGLKMQQLGVVEYIVESFRVKVVTTSDTSTSAIEVQSTASTATLNVRTGMQS